MKSQKNKVEISNLPNKELKVMFIIILKELRRRMDKDTDKLKVSNKQIIQKRTKQS